MTAVEWLVDKICTDVEMYDEYGEVNGVEFWNAFRSCTDLSEYINQANEMFEQQIIDAYETSHISMMTSKQYYNETFKSE
jgi:uncharacterized protein YuzE